MSFRGFARAHDFGRVRFASAWLSWGAIAGTTAGEVLRVGYTVTRPALTGAQLQLADGRVLELAVLADRLEVLLPFDTPAGWATITATLDDAAGTSATATLEVLLVGAPSGPSVPTPYPAGGPPRARPHRLVRSAPARTAIAAGPSSLRRRSAPRTVVVRARSSAPRVGRPPVFSGRSAAVGVRLAVGAGRVRGQLRTGAAAIVLATGATSVTRRDGPALEEALLLDLL